jgi:hypothetical protein
MFCSAATAAPGSDSHSVSVAQRRLSATAVGTLQTVFGLATITRANGIATSPAQGDPVYEGDLIETGIDGLVIIEFVDGGTFRLYANSRMVLDEVICGVEKSSSLALLRVTQGLFGFGAAAGAIPGRLIVDTPVAQIRSTAATAGFGSVIFSIFTFGLIHELKAESADIAVLDDGMIDYKHLKHGHYEIVTKEEHPRHIDVDDPGETVVLRVRGSSLSVEQVPNSPLQMAQLQTAFNGAYATYLQGLQDPFIQQYHRADAQPQSTGSTGSSTSASILSENNNNANGNNDDSDHNNQPQPNHNNEPTTSTPPPPTIVAIVIPPPPPLPPPPPPPTLVTISDTEVMNNLVVAVNMILNIDGGTVFVSNSVTNMGTLEVTSGGFLDVSGNINNSGGTLVVEKGTVDEALNISGGNIIIEGGSLTIIGSSDASTTFENGATSAPSYGELVLGSPTQFSGQIFGFGGTSTSQSDQIFLIGFDATSQHLSTSGGNTVLTLGNGITEFSLTFDGFTGSLNIAAGLGGTAITDPPTTNSSGNLATVADGTIARTGGRPTDAHSAGFTTDGTDHAGAFLVNEVNARNDGALVKWQLSLENDRIKLVPSETLTQPHNYNHTHVHGATVNQTISVSIGGASADNFVFHPALVADTIVNPDPHSDTIDLNGFSNIQSEQHLASLITSDSHDHTVIDLAHSDGITVPGMNPAELHAVLQSFGHLI